LNAVAGIFREKEKKRKEKKKELEGVLTLPYILDQ
jgi:hypothetical protein